MNLRNVVTFTARAGALMLASGAAASDAVEAALDVARKAGLENVSADVTYTGFSLSYNPEKEVPYTRIEPIRGRTFDYGKLADLANLAARYGNRELTTGAVQDALTGWHMTAAGRFFATCAILPMLPGLALYRALSATAHIYAGNLQLFAQAISIALALAAGVSFGEYLTIGARRRLRVVESRFSARAATPPAVRGQADGTRPPADRHKTERSSSPAHPEPGVQVKRPARTSRSLAPGPGDTVPVENRPTGGWGCR